jgi:hypothetical protein
MALSTDAVRTQQRKDSGGLFVAMYLKILITGSDLNRWHFFRCWET